MITIIKQGNKMTAECPHCECVFTYQDEDIEWGDQRDPYKVVKCPCCSQKIDLIGRVRTAGMRYLAK